jgi:hypothetical protein
MPAPLVAFVVLAAATAAGTVLVGWWAVPLLAAAFGLAVRGRLRFVPLVAGLAALGAWGGLLLAAAGGDRFGALVGGLAVVMQLGDAALMAVTLLFPFALAWSAATLGEAIGGRVRSGAAAAAAAAAPSPSAGVPGAGAPERPAGASLG